MSKLVLAVSDRWVADARVDALADFAARMSAGILVTHVILGSETSATAVTPGERILEQVAAVFRARQLKVDTLLLFSDDIAGAIVKTAAEHAGSLIVLGLASKGMIARLIEGNVAQEIAKSTRVPVLMLPADWKGEI